MISDCQVFGGRKGWIGRDRGFLGQWKYSDVILLLELIVLIATKYTVVENWHRTYKNFNHNKALSVQTWCPFSTDHFGKKPYSDLKTHILFHTHRDTLKSLLLFTVCWEQYILLFQIYGTPSVLFPVVSGKKQSNYKEYTLFPGHRQLWWK
jgi:hypothetical protein